VFVVVYDDEQVFVAAFQDGKLKRVVEESAMDKVQQTLFASAVTCSLPGLAITVGGAAAAEVDTGDSDFGTPSAPGA
jgi:hypothetical protein